MNNKTDFQILVVRNLVGEYKLSDDLERFADWVREHTPLNPVFTFLDTAFDNLEHKPFKQVGDQTWYGLKDIKDRLRQTGEITKYAYKSVIFLYDFEDSIFEPLPGGTRAGGWCYYNDLDGATFIEVPILPYSDAREDAPDDLYRVLTHEIIHAFHRLCWWEGIATPDTMDSYYKEFEVEAPDGNRAMNLKVLEPYWDIIGKQPLFRQILALLFMLVPSLQRKIREMQVLKENEMKSTSRLNDWAKAIQEYEGWYAPGENGYTNGSRSYRNNNPGNLRASKYETGKDSGGYSIFEDFDHGWEALIFQLQIAVDGRSRVYKPEMTLLEFFRTYAPSSDNNHPDTYAEFVANRLGVSILTKIKELG